MRYLDMLTRLGVGSAHPGGFSATLDQMQRYPLPPGSRILEVGCGTGRTACYLARQGFAVTGLDLRPEMLVKAAARSASEQLHVDWVEGSVTALPFPDETFDVVLAESVTNFTHIPEALAEYYRVLRPGGTLYDREVLALAGLKESDSQMLRDFFEFGGLFNEEEWLSALSAAGYERFELVDRSLFEEHLSRDQMQHPDLHQMMDHEAIMDPAVWQISLRHDELIDAHRDRLGYALIRAEK